MEHLELIECQLNCECVWDSKPFCSSSKLMAHYHILRNFKPHLQNHFEMVSCLCEIFFDYQNFQKKPFRNMPIFSIYSGMDSPEWWKIFTPAALGQIDKIRLTMTYIVEVYPHPSNLKYYFKFHVCLSVDIVIDGLTAEPKNSKTLFFSRFSKSLLISHWNWSENAPVFFFLKNLNKYGP